MPDLTTSRPEVKVTVTFRLPTDFRKEWTPWVNFTGHYEEPGVYFDGSAHHIWEYSMVGNSPDHGGTTTFNAPIVPVTIDLRNFDGSPRFVNGHRLISSPAAFVEPVPEFAGVFEREFLERQRSHAD